MGAFIQNVNSFFFFSFSSYVFNSQIFINFRFTIRYSVLILKGYTMNSTWFKFETFLSKTGKATKTFTKCLCNNTASWNLIGKPEVRKLMSGKTYFTKKICINFNNNNNEEYNKHNSSCLRHFHRTSYLRNFPC